MLNGRTSPFQTWPSAVNGKVCGDLTGLTSRLTGCRLANSWVENDRRSCFRNKAQHSNFGGRFGFYSISSRMWRKKVTRGNDTKASDSTGKPWTSFAPLTRIAILSTTSAFHRRCHSSALCSLQITQDATTEHHQQQCPKSNLDKQWVKQIRCLEARQSVLWEDRRNA